MTALEAFRRFQEFRRLGQFDHIAEVLDTENYVENCVGFTGWTLGFDTALAKNSSQDLLALLRKKVDGAAAAS